MNQGKVKFFNESKGYGFISTSNGDIFFHISGVNNNVILQENDMVNFDIQNDIKGEKAVNVSKA